MPNQSAGAANPSIGASSPLMSMWWRNSVPRGNREAPMSEFPELGQLKNNRGLVTDPIAFAREAGAASWLFLCGEAFAQMEGGMSYADVQAAVASSANVVSDPPVQMDMDLA